MERKIGEYGRKYTLDSYDVDPITGCWNARGRIRRDGYVQRKRPGTQQQVKVHRLMWESVNGPVPDGMELDHRCRNKRCCNPDHLEAVTHATNIRRSALAKLTAEQVAEIRHALAIGRPMKTIAEQYGIARSHVSRIKNGVRWAPTP